MKTKKAIIAAILLAAATIISVKSVKNTAPLTNANVEVLAEIENDLGICNGCSTDKSIFCCHLIIVDLGGWFLYKD